MYFFIIFYKNSFHWFLNQSIKFNHSWNLFRSLIPYGFRWLHFFYRYFLTKYVFADCIVIFLTIFTLPILHLSACTASIAFCIDSTQISIVSIKKFLVNDNRNQSDDYWKLIKSYSKSQESSSLKSRPSLNLILVVPQLWSLMECNRQTCFPRLLGSQFSSLESTRHSAPKGRSTHQSGPSYQCFLRRSQTHSSVRKFWHWFNFCWASVRFRWSTKWKSRG